MLCGDDEGWGPFSTTRDYDFTNCFELLFISTLPKLLAIFLGIPRLIKLRQKSSSPVPFDAFFYSKVGCSILIALMSIFKLFWILSFYQSLDSILSCALDVFCFTLMSVVIYLEHLRSRISSTVVLFFWLLQNFAELILIRTSILTLMYSHDLVLFSLIISYLVFGLILFILENIPKTFSYYMSLEEDESDNPEQYANVFSKLIFQWMDPLMKRGFSKVLDMDDLWKLKSQDTAEWNSELFQTCWSEQLLKKRPSLIHACFKSFGFMFMCAAIFKFMQDCLAFIQPQFLKLMMDFANSWNLDATHPQPLTKGFLISFAMLFSALCQTLVLHQYFQLCLVTGMRAKAAMVTAIYRKALKLSNVSRQSSTVGEIVNLMSVDATRLADLFTYLHILWSGPFQISLAIYFLYQSLGPPVFGGVAVMVLMIPINAYLATKSRNFNKIQMRNKDTRTKLMDELLNGIRVIKLYAWENAFLKKIWNVREAELSMLKKIGYLQAIQTFTWSCTPFLVSFTSFGIYALTSDEPLTSTKIFVSISLFNLLQFPLSVFPSVITAVIEASVSFTRLYNFLMSEELDPDAISYEPITPFSPIGNSIQRIAIHNGSFRWDPTQDDVLSQIEFSVNDGEMLAIIGPVGAGKSSLISALLGEMYRSCGGVYIRGSIAYVPQTAWIMNGTVRENILFGRHYDESFYHETISACGLIPDFEHFVASDMTEIGERGVNLSGGQKQRISLARAIYARADIYLLDDSLSAVDAHVGRHIFDRVMGPQGLLKSRARVFVTNAVHILPMANNIIMLSHGSITEHGTFKELMKRKGSLFNLMNEYGKQHSDIGSSTKASKTTNQISRKPIISSLGRMNGHATLMSKEDVAKGSVSWSVYKAYADACSHSSVALFLLIAVASQILSVSQNLYLAQWASFNDTIQAHPNVDQNLWIWLGVYGFLGIIYSISVVLQVIFVWVRCGIKSARVLHVQMLNSIIHLPQSFFDTTPIGRILNRFSKDQYTVDEILPRSFQGYFRTLFSIFAVLGVNAYGSPMYLLLALPLAILYYHFQKYYLATSRELKRLDSTSRSPIFAHFQETLGGVSTIRAYKAENRFISANEFKIDQNQMAYYPSISSNRWLAVRLEFIGALVVFGSAMSGVFTIMMKGSIPASIMGLMLTYSLSITQTLNWMVRQSCEIETNIVSVERIKEYTELEKEAAYETDVQIPRDWPHGSIRFENYSVRYRQGLDLVLNDLNIAIKAKEKIGIVGRTGAGKSSLTLALFRLIEASHGHIYIDNIDISSLGLKDLRSRLTIIPQDPFLFSGTIRENLDPFHEKTDADVWESLAAANLKDYIRALPGALDFIVTQGGENFSVGQRQLICLARALLRRTNILILDEATASIDIETDNIIQQTIRLKFKDSTVFTIAHRIHTVMDNDKILVLEKGKIVELDSPSNLLSNKASKFYGLAKEAGLTSS